MKIRQCMTPDPQVAGPDESAREVLRRMRTIRIRHLPVVEDGALVGIISERDLVALERAHPTHAPAAPAARELLHGVGPRLGAARRDSFDDPCVSDLMTREVVVVHPEDTVRVAVERFLEHRFGALPVVDPDGGALIGILSPIDVLKAWHDLATGSRTRS